MSADCTDIDADKDLERISPRTVQRPGGRWRSVVQRTVRPCQLSEPRCRYGDVIAARVEGASFRWRIASGSALR